MAVAVVSLVFGILSVVIGGLSLATAIWYPTLSVILGLVAVAYALLGVRRAADGGNGAAAGVWERRVALIGLGMGAGGIVTTIVYVIVTTGP
jgi:hypothetical protein